MKALLVIDMQKSVFTTPRYDKDGVINRINNLASIVRDENGLVIFIQHNGSVEEDMNQGSKGWEIIDELNVVDNDIKITKTACDSFFKTDLESILKEYKVKDVIITGAVTELCVDTTFRSCLSKELNVTMISDGHTTGDREHLKANLIIQHHNWTWKNIIIPNTNIEVVKTNELITQLKALHKSNDERHIQIK
ncbi:isochorismatase family protein [Aquimarina sediminis]|uniref:isochorismatase family protein n=1 Tax=Aquimarina sediminis TaxID=2070536 RepID=UPI000CA00EFF|nr:isochorismatase family protein [Aquimarina sediminis]